MRPEDGIGVPLTLVDNSGRRIDTGPEEVVFGALRLSRWHVHPVAGVHAAFPGKAAHLVKINYDLRIDPGAPVMRWFEIGFPLADRDSTVVAAVPRGATEPQPATSYALSRNLEFVPVDNSAALVHIPPTDGPVHVYGASGDSIRWLHVAPGRTGVRPGSYSAWIVLLTPGGRTEQKFRLTARFEPRLADGDDFHPVPKSTEFSISLTESTRSPLVEAEKRGGSGVGLPRPSPRVFICYAHEDETHKKKVRDFADLLRESGLDPRIDKDQEGPRTEWDHWALREIREADFVAVIASPTCKAVGEGTYESTGHPGIRSELGVIRNLLQKHPEWRSYLLPIVLPGCSTDDIPMFLHPATMDHYIVEALTRTEIEYLLKTIRATQPWQGWGQR
ncbi:SEFIR domain-containing protein [Kibdelosporangium persicum]|uniref:SEFIR domain-containing protein n=1 Tax=Kibdelosporangium persicum TaxID=2698649 RepID=A0ABX2FFL5_9PSEU|nr:toll/interleukin-1 receptor domain-containing protein [Kibdelosporangium persicum]NRN70179.1 SEFIR domain-containing protein [Kibdelosporangium persicum]